MDWVNVAIQGILLGGLYALSATGLASSSASAQMVNLAHGDLGILAAFLSLFLITSLQVGVFWSGILAVIVMFIIGYVVQRGLLNFTLGTDDTRPIDGHVRISIIIQNGLQLWFSADSQGLDAGRIENISIKIKDSSPSAGSR